ncbi:dCTP deaminase/dUTPase family protein [Blattabacterium cuenoti]|uniref:dUTP diphosphatase n=1 Tax=Blattabacterium cuenoti TaxID=1653831 RepID=UPI00163D2969|nr:dUTP diphosphatase [Blattabacterium cuenoti]
MLKKIYQSALIAKTQKSVSINFLERKLIPTGIFIKISINTRYYFFLKRKFIESICIIHLTKNKEDIFYKEINIIIINVFFKNMIIEPYEKLGILDIIKGVKVKWNKCLILNQSIRGSNSFGSTGI